MIVYDDLRQVFENNKVETAEYAMLEDKIFDLSMQAELDPYELNKIYYEQYGVLFYKADKETHKKCIKDLQKMIREKIK